MTSAEPSLPSDGVPRQRTVLVVDDQPDHCMLLEALLNAEGYRCRSCASLADALTELEHQRVDLIFTDSFS